MGGPTMGSLGRCPNNGTVSPMSGCRLSSLLLFTIGLVFFLFHFGRGGIFHDFFSSSLRSTYVSMTFEIGTEQISPYLFAVSLILCTFHSAQIIQLSVYHHSELPHVASGIRNAGASIARHTCDFRRVSGRQRPGERVEPCRC
jgi:hypothetical protein